MLRGFPTIDSLNMQLCCAIVATKYISTHTYIIMSGVATHLTPWLYLIGLGTIYVYVVATAWH